MTFIQENQITPLNKDPTELFPKKSSKPYKNEAHLSKKANTILDEYKTYSTKVKCIHKNT
jgi:hypothetical protein